jgi:hypothetical protein
MLKSHHRLDWPADHYLQLRVGDPFRNTVWVQSFGNLEYPDDL